MCVFASHVGHVLGVTRPLQCHHQVGLSSSSSCDGWRVRVRSVIRVTSYEGSRARELISEVA